MTLSVKDSGGLAAALPGAVRGLLFSGGRFDASDVFQLTPVKKKKQSVGQLLRSYVIWLAFGNQPKCFYMGGFAVQPPCLDVGMTK